VCAGFLYHDQARTDWMEKGRKQGDAPPGFLCTMNVSQLHSKSNSSSAQEPVQVKPLKKHWEEIFQAPAPF
jgi:hypothetical protein